MAWTAMSKPEDFSALPIGAWTRAPAGAAATAGSLGQRRAATHAGNPYPNDSLKTRDQEGVKRVGNLQKPRPSGRMQRSNGKPSPSFSRFPLQLRLPPGHITSLRRGQLAEQSQKLSSVHKLLVAMSLSTSTASSLSVDSQAACTSESLRTLRLP